MINLQQVTLRRGTQVLLDQTNLTIYAGQRIGVVGANGAGKSTLFALLLGQLQIDAGNIQFPKQLRIAHLAQETPGLTISAHAYVMQGDKELHEIETKLQDETLDGETIAKLYGDMQQIDGYTAPARASQLLAGLGFPEETHQHAVKSFSGGWRVRLNLARALMSRSDLLLLDEPTNHLDLDAVLWLEQWIQHYQGTLLMISHDRDFLDKTISSIVHLENKQLNFYSGNYSTFEKERAMKLMLQQAAYEKQQQQIAHLQSFINRFKAKASKAKQAQSRVKAIERMELVCAVQADSPFQFKFQDGGPCPNPLMTLQQASVAYGDHVVLRNLSFSIRPKERIAILGPNGAGKSSLIKLLAGVVDPATGIRECASGVKIGYFAQHQVDELDLSLSPYETMQTVAKGVSETALRSYLGSFGFNGDMAFAPIQHFSGGEKTRLALALLVYQKPNFLLLDEPTNHLDLEMRQALSLALQEYEGAMLLVSHDRFLVRTTTDELWLVANQAVQPFEGDLDDYQKWLVDYRKQQLALAVTPKKDDVKKNARQQSAQQREALKPLMTRIKNLEKQIESHQRELAKLAAILADEQLYHDANKQTLQTSLQKQAQIQKALQQAEDEWLLACEEREQLS